VTLADNRVALATGGSRGLGRSTALARDGADVIVTYRTQKRTALEVVHEIEAQDRKAAALPLDVGDVSTGNDPSRHRFRQWLPRRRGPAVNIKPPIA